MASELKKVLFLCSDNCCRSLFAESILRKDGGGRFLAFSAGPAPGTAIHPLALDVLRSVGYPTDGLHPKNWFQFERPDAPAMDFVLTLCDQTPPRECPVWPGQPEAALWPMPDPAQMKGTDAEIATAFVRTFDEIKGHLNLFLALPFDRLDRYALRADLAGIHGLARAG